MRPKSQGTEGPRIRQMISPLTLAFQQMEGSCLLFLTLWCVGSDQTRELDVSPVNLGK